MSNALTKLHTTMLDTRDGYAAAERDAEGESLKTLFRRIIEMRERHHAEIHKALAERGDEPDDGTSIMATVHKAAVTLRSAVTGIDRSALAPFIKGEESVLEEYDAAIAESPGAVAEMLHRQKAEVVAMIEAMRSL